MKTFYDGRLKVESGDITTVDTDAIVNAANSSLLGGGGVDGAIHRAGGPSILEECGRIRKTKYPEGLPAGEAVATHGGRLKARWVIHTAGPVWHGGGHGEDALLENAYRSSIRLAGEMGLSSLAFPAISTGVYGFPRDRAARIVAAVLRNYFSGDPLLDSIRLVFYSAADEETFLLHAGPILLHGKE